MTRWSIAVVVVAVPLAVASARNNVGQASVAALAAELVPQRAMIDRIRRAGAVRPVRTPPGLAPCRRGLEPSGPMPASQGETLRYVVDIDGLSVGTVDFKIERRGRFGGQNVTEYRSLFAVDTLVANFVPVEGRAASLVPDGAHSPSMAMSRFNTERNEYEEDMHYAPEGMGISSNRKKNGQAKRQVRAFPVPVHDFISAFYSLRTLDRKAAGCSLVYGNHRAYTVWIEPTGTEKVKTPVGSRDADRYTLRYASERSKRPYEATVWMGQGADRLPYKAVIRGKNNTLEARIHTYRLGD